MIASPLLVRAFELLYGPLAGVYDAVSAIGFAGEWRRWQREVVRSIDDGPVLELGAGTGDLLPHLAAAGLRPTGLDRSPTMLAQARRKLLRRQLASVLVRGDATALPFRTATFGSVVATFPGGYILATETWREIARVLRPGGRAVIATAGTLAPDSPGRAVRAALYQLLYRPGPLRLALPTPPGFDVRELTSATRHGQVHLLVVTKPDSGAAA